MKYLLGLTDGRNEPIKDLDNTKRIVLVDKDTVGAEDITFAYCKFEAKTSTHKKHVHKDAEELIYILSGRGVSGLNEEEVEMVQDVGCEHACSYCYARYMKKFTKHAEPWGEFVDVKVNAVDLLRAEIKKKKPGRVWISGVCDPYQPLESKYQLTRKCLVILTEHGWPVVIQTRSPLVLRDLDILKGAASFEVGFSIPTADDRIRAMFEPKAPSVGARLDALDELSRSGVMTYAMIAPILPGAGLLPKALTGKVRYVLVDRMNYNYADWVYRKYGLQGKLSDDYFCQARKLIYEKCTELGLECRLVC